MAIVIPKSSHEIDHLGDVLPAAPVFQRVLHGPALPVGACQAVYPLGMPFYLMRGESAEVGGAGLFATFDDILFDNRCPIDVVCVWEGDAEAQLIAINPIRADGGSWSSVKAMYR